MNAIFVAAVANELAVLHARAQQLVGEGVRSDLSFGVDRHGTHVEWICSWGIPYASPLAWDCREVRHRDGSRHVIWRVTRASRTVISSSDRQRDDMLARSPDGLEELAQLLARVGGDADAV